MPAKLLPSAQYKALLKDVLSLRDEADAASASAKVSSYWAIGNRIKKLRLSKKSGYHNSVIRDLAADSGLAIRTLHQSLRLSADYENPPDDEGLTWSHYRALLTLPSSGIRDFYIKKTQKNNWSARQLEAAVRADLHQGKKAKTRALKRPADPDYLYLALVTDLVDGDTLDVDIDLGFGVSRKLRVRLAVIDCPEPSTAKGRNARDFVASQLMRARTIVLKTEKSDIYGRFVAHVFFTFRETSISSCFKNGTYLNELLVEEKHAIVIG